MKFNMVCIKFDQKNLKNLNFDFSGFLGFLKNLKNLGFFRSHFPALVFIATYSVLVLSFVFQFQYYYLCAVLCI